MSERNIAADNNSVSQMSRGDSKVFQNCHIYKIKIKGDYALPWCLISVVFLAWAGLISCALDQDDQVIELRYSNPTHITEEVGGRTEPNGKTKSEKFDVSDFYHLMPYYNPELNGD